MGVNYTLQCIVAVKNDVYGWSNEVGTIITLYLHILVLCVPAHEMLKKSINYEFLYLQGNIITNNPEKTKYNESLWIKNQIFYVYKTY